LQVLASGVDLDAFYQRIASAPERVLMLDYDGTLAPFHERPECALPYPGIATLLHEIMEAGGTRLVVVSGRPASELPPLLGLGRPPEIWGTHGWERLLPDGTRHLAEPDGGARAGLDDAAAAVHRMTGHGARIERKLASVALHWRGLAPELARQLEGEARALWEPAARGGALELLPFDGGLELRARGCTKARAVESILAQAGAASAIAYLGDDMTDEDAFRAVKPRGLAVLVRGALRETAADIWIEPPAELFEFLRRWRIGRTGT
jgi:trehalose 6-phosphate phosphatase